MSDSLRPHEPQHTRPPCPSPTPGVHPNPCPLSWWCHPIISSSVIPFSSCPQSFPASGSFQMSQFFASGGQIIGVSASTSSPSNEYSRLISFRMDWLNLLLTQIPPNQKTQKEQKLRWALRAKERAFYWPRQPEKEAQWDISWEKQKSNPSFCPEEKHGVLSGGLTAKWNQEHRHL